MAMTRKTITITDQMDDWVKGLVESGKYGNDSEYFRDLIRKDQSKEDNLETLRNLLVEGEQSGSSDLSVTDIWDEAEERHQGHDLTENA
ncbi:MAG: type II toxin-antitoxin system ParD family antitoxin [Rhodospirillaceae bacterium]|jgi:antitoxin ParD1/3/4|nr:type II toxin-antitoxin system ParD family antitoxin [Rhodospirillaceae bacterium]|tara:strand:+ start:560 stop:826 length:267 start_codon:yes stop_codon:yes gene_type:complete